MSQALNQSSLGMGPGALDYMRQSELPEVRIALYVRESLYRRGLQQLLQAQPSLRITTLTGVEGAVLGECRQHRPELLVFSDGRLPRAELRALLARLDSELPGVKVLLVAEPDQISPEEAIQAGAWGYLPHDAPPELLTKAIRSIAAGEVWAPRSTLSKLVRERRAGAAERKETEPPLLSERELEVLRLVAEGRENEAIGAALHIETSTVKTHLVRIFRKLRVSDRVSAVRAAEELGLIRSRSN